MLIYSVKRIGLALVIVLVAMTMLFSMIYVVPGDPASIALGPRATPEMKAQLIQRMGLDQPLPVQLANFIGGVLRGDLGVDVWSNRSVAAIILDALPHTLALTALGLGWSVVLGIVLGCFSATHPGSWLDRAIGVLSVSAIAVPSFVVALYSLLVFAVALRWLPAIGAGEAGNPADQLRHFGGAVLSYETGSIKPEPEIYHHAITAHGLKPAETRYIDDLPANIATGKKLGFRSWQYDLTDHAAFERWLAAELLHG